MEAYLKGTGKLTKKQADKELAPVSDGAVPAPRGRPRLACPGLGLVGAPAGAKDLERFYPIIDGKPTVAYLWARTVTCKNCRATIPLLKTRWLCKKDNKRVVLTMEPNADKTGVVYRRQNRRAGRRRKRCAEEGIRQEGRGGDDVAVGRDLSML